MVQVGVVYTVNPPQMVELVQTELRRALCMEGLEPDVDSARQPDAACARSCTGELELRSYADPSILEEAGAAGFVGARPAARLVSMYLQAVQDGADAVLNCCSTVGEVVDSAQDLACYLGVPWVRIDEGMCYEAVRRAASADGRVGVLATAATTLDPTERTLLRAARSVGQRIRVENALVEGTGGLSSDGYRKALLAGARQLVGRVDVLVLAQASMASCEGYLAERTGLPTLSSPRFGAAAVRAALERGGRL